MIDPSRSGRGGCCLLRLVDLIQDGVEVDRGFGGVLPSLKKPGLLSPLSLGQGKIAASLPGGPGVPAQHPPWSCCRGGGDQGRSGASYQSYRAEMIPHSKATATAMTIPVIM